MGDTTAYVDRLRNLEKSAFVRSLVASTTKMPNPLTDMLDTVVRRAVDDEKRHENTWNSFHRANEVGRRLPLVHRTCKSGTDTKWFDTLHTRSFVATAPCTGARELAAGIPRATYFFLGVGAYPKGIVAFVLDTSSVLKRPASYTPFDSGSIDNPAFLCPIDTTILATWNDTAKDQFLAAHVGAGGDSMKIDKCKIVGAMAAPRGNAPFDRANLVIQSNLEPYELAQVRAYIGTDEVDVIFLHADEWKTLLNTEQAIELPPTDLVSGAAFWVLRSSFSGRDAALEELQTSGVLVHSPVRLGDASFGLIVSEHGPEALRLRDQWARDAFAEAQKWAADGHWERARTSATRAFVTERAMNSETVAMLALTYEKCGNATRAAGYLKMAERTHGADFAAQIREKRADIEKELQTAPSNSEIRPKFARDIHKNNAIGLANGRERVKLWQRAA